MVRLTRRLALYVGSLLALVAVYTVAYRWGMATLEGETRTWYGALEIVVQSMTTFHSEGVPSFTAGGNRVTERHKPPFDSRPTPEHL